jgi:uncharacterized protein
MIKVAINGSSGFLGTQLCKFLKHKYNIITLKRSDYSIAPDKLALLLEGSDYVINLAGASIFGLWTKSTRRRILNSRIDVTRNLVAAIALMDRRPKLLITASGVNIYDDQHLHTEESMLYASDFLGEVVMKWEHEALKCVIPVAIIRTGLVLDRRGGFFKSLTQTLPFKFVVKFGSGSAFFPFIALGDYLSAMEFIISNNLQGVFNMVAPAIPTYTGFYRSLQKVFSIFVLPIPAFILKVLPGRQSDLFLKGQQVVPQRLLNEGFTFGCPDITTNLQILSE